MTFLTNLCGLFIKKGANEPQSEKPLPPDVERETESVVNNTHKTSYWEGLVHMFRATMGTGVLGLPYAFSQAGYVTGIIGIIFVSNLSLYCAVTLSRCHLILKKNDKNVVPTFQGSVEAAFAQGPKKYRRFSPFFVSSTNILLLLGQLGGVAVYLVFVSVNAKAIADPYFEWDIRLWTVVVSVPVLAMTMIKNLKHLTVISNFGNTVILASVGVIFYYILSAPLSFENRSAFGKFENLPQFLGTVIFACGYLNMVMPLQSEMAKPEDLGKNLGVLDVNAIITTVLYVIFGFLGYLRYGDKAQGSVTLNLPGEVVGTAVKALLAFSVMSATVLQNYITISIVWDDYLEKKLTRNRKAVQYLIRIVINLLTLAIAISVPNLELLVAILGNVGQIMVSSGLPSIIHYLTCNNQTSTWGYIKEFWMDVVNILFSVFILITSMNTTILQIIGN